MIEEFKGKLIYLAAPYSHEREEVIELRMELINKGFAHLIAQGYMVISPLTQGHIAKCLFDCPGDWSFWRNLSIRLLRCCDAMFVMRLDGWRDSKGVKEEERIAGELNIPVYYI